MGSLHQLHIVLGKHLPHDLSPHGKGEFFIYGIVSRKICKPLLLPVQLGIFCFLRMILIHGLYVCYKIALFLLCDQITLHQELFIGIHHGFHTDPIISGKLSSGRQLCSRQETASENVLPQTFIKTFIEGTPPFFH